MTWDGTCFWTFESSIATYFYSHLNYNACQCVYLDNSSAVVMTVLSHCLERKSLASDVVSSQDHRNRLVFRETIKQ